MNPYSNEKALAWPHRIDGLRQGETIAPVHVHLSISDTCNHGCWFCAYRTPGYSSNAQFDPHLMMLTAKAKQIIADCAAIGVKAIQFTGGGEPTVHPDHLDLWKLASNCMSMALVTNGELLTDEDIEWLAQKATWIRVSVDAATAETWARIRSRPAERFTRVVRNLEKLAAAGAPVSASFIATAENTFEIGSFVELMDGIGVSSLRFGPPTGTNINEVANGIVAEIQRCPTTSIQITNQLVTRSKPATPLRPRCWIQEFTPFIGADLGIYRCCVYAYNPRGRIGSLKGQSLHDWWQNLTKETFTEFDARNCKCPFVEKNEAIQRVMDAKHREFV